jgi:putative endonuclease
MLKRSTQRIRAKDDARGHEARPMRAKRERWRVGRAAEEAVVAWLTVRGIRVLGTNVRVNYLEVDILAQDGRTLALVEVRTRSPTSWTSALGSVDHLKRVRLRRAGERLWRRKFKYRSDIDHVRFDVASVSWTSGELQVEYIKAAF